MKRDLQKMRDLENRDNIDIIEKKAKVMETLLSDPDLLDVLGKKECRENPYRDKRTGKKKENLTPEQEKECIEIDNYNEECKNSQIVDFLKLNDLQKYVRNYIMYDIYDERTDYDNYGFKRQYLIIMIVINEDDMITEYGIDMTKESKNKEELGKYMITRADLIDYIIKDLFNWSNVLGNKLVCYMDEPKIMDTHYYARELRFVTQPANTIPRHGGLRNRYDPQI